MEEKNEGGRKRKEVKRCEEGNNSFCRGRKTKRRGRKVAGEGKEKEKICGRGMTTERREKIQKGMKI